MKISKVLSYLVPLTLLIGAIWTYQYINKTHYTRFDLSFTALHVKEAKIKTTFYLGDTYTEWGKVYFIDSLYLKRMQDYLDRTFLDDSYLDITKPIYLRGNIIDMEIIAVSADTIFDEYADVLRDITSEKMAYSKLGFSINDTKKQTNQDWAGYGLIRYKYSSDDEDIIKPIPLTWDHTINDTLWYDMTYEYFTDSVRQYYFTDTIDRWENQYNPDYSPRSNSSYIMKPNIKFGYGEGQIGDFFPTFHAESRGLIIINFNQYCAPFKPVIPESTEVEIIFEFPNNLIFTKINPQPDITTANEIKFCKPETIRQICEGGISYHIVDMDRKEKITNYNTALNVVFGVLLSLLVHFLIEDVRNLPRKKKVKVKGFRGNN